MRYRSASLRRTLVMVALLAGCAVASLIAAGTFHSGARPTLISPGGGGCPDCRRGSGLPVTARGVLSRAVGRSERAFAVFALAGGFAARNAGQGYVARFSGTGVAVRTPRGSFGLSLRGVGY